MEEVNQKSCMNENMDMKRKLERLHVIEFYIFIQQQNNFGTFKLVIFECMQHMNLVFL